MFPPESTQAPFSLALPQFNYAGTLVIHHAALDDRATAQSIFAYHVLHSTATCTRSPSNEQEMRTRLTHAHQPMHCLGTGTQAIRRLY